MDNLSPPETRGRSRSKTPFLRSSCDRELCSQIGHDHTHERRVKKSPLVQTIVEERVERSSPVVNQHFQSSSQQKSSRVVTSDYSSEETSPDLARARGNTVKTTYVTETYTVSRSGHSNSLQNAAATKISPSSSSLLRETRSAIKSKETSQNEINSAFEESKMQTSTPILMGNSRKIQFTSPPSNGQVSDHISYKEYKEAGEYWNKYPKTDYTYSRLSPHRREVVPGVIAMPNMSRKSLDKHSERIDFMIKQNPAQESYIRQRYETTRHTTNRQTKVQKDIYYDSQDEVDLAQQYNTYRQTQTKRYTKSNYAAAVREESLITRFLTYIVTLFSRVTSIFWRSEENLYYTRIEENRGFFSRILSAISTVILSIFRPIYMAISSVLYLDTWLLRSSSADSKTKKRFLLLLLLLLPLLLLGGFQYYLNPNYEFPPYINITSYQIPNFNDLKINTIEKFEDLKLSTVEKIDDLKNLSEDYYIYLKAISQNMISEVQKIWIENFSV